jgi:transposase InsO family protein
VFVTHLASRRVQILGSTPFPDEAFYAPGRVLADHGRRGHLSHPDLCRDAKWRGPVGEILQNAGIRVVETPYRAPNAKAYAERLVRSIKEECLDRMVPLSERHFRRAVHEVVQHYHLERNHQGLGNVLIDGAPARSVGAIRRRSRLGGLLNYYERAP